MKQYATQQSQKEINYQNRSKQILDVVVARPSRSPWASPMVLVTRKDMATHAFLVQITNACTQGPFTLWTMKLDHERWPLSMIRVHGPTSMVRLLKKLVLKALGPSLGVNQMWNKKNHHAPKSEGACFFNRCPKRVVLIFFLKFDHSRLLLGFTCLPFLLSVSRMWLANLLTTIFTKK